jgi:multiple sugar transport system permease protein
MKILQEIKNKSYAYMFILPMAAGMLIIHFTPLVMGIIMSFLDLNQYTLPLYLKSPFVGLKNYYDLLFNPSSTIRIGLLQAVRNTIIYTIFVTGGTLGLGMIIALMLNENIKGVKLFRTLFLFPWIIPTYVTGLLWAFIWNHDIGVVNYFLVKVFKLFTTPPFWLLGPNTLWAIIIPTVWRYWPYSMLMLLAGLQTIPDELNEAAVIDGASEWQRFWYITLPLLKPVWSILILVGLISNVYSFNIVIMMFGHGAGFPGEWGDLVMTNIFRNSFQLWQYSKGAAASIVLMIAMIGVVALWYKVFGKEKW